MRINPTITDTLRKYRKIIKDITPLVSCSESIIRFKIEFKNSTNLRIEERKKGKIVIRYSYYWLNEKNKLTVGWDNAPHHTHLKTFPHHKHIGPDGRLEKSPKMTLSKVLKTIQVNLARF